MHAKSFSPDAHFGLRLPRWFSRAAFLALCGLSAGCLIQPAPVPLASQPTPGPLRLIVNDALLQEIVCDSFAGQPGLQCGGPETWAPDELGSGPMAIIDARIVESSRDLLRNTGLSIATMTTLLMVSTSGTVEYTTTIRSRNDADPTALRRVALRSRGRVGMWSVIPFYTGLVGTWIGTALNDYRRPERLREACLTRRGATDEHAIQSNPGSDARSSESSSETPPDFDPCADYRDFLQDSYAHVHVRLRRLLADTRETEGRRESDVSI